MESKHRLVVLKDRRDFLRLKNEGSRIKVRHWLLLNVRHNQERNFRCGWTLTRKVGSAVTRNKIKRWTREFFRKKASEENVPRLDINVVFCHAGNDFYKKLSFSEFQKGICAAWLRVEKFDRSEK